MDTQITKPSMKTPFDCITNFLPLNCLQGFNFSISFGMDQFSIFFFNFRLCKYVDLLKVTNSLLT